MKAFGFAAVALSFLVGSFPPTQLPVGSPSLHVGLVIGRVGITGLPLLIGTLKQSSRRSVVTDKLLHGRRPDDSVDFDSEALRARLSTCWA